MSSFKNFQSDNIKHSKDRFDIYNADFNPSINAKSVEQVDNFTKNLPKYIDFVAWSRWFP